MAACNQPGCGGVDHRGLCHKCPHDGGTTFGAIAWEETPCARCQAGDSREQGHGRGVSYEETPPVLVAQPETDMPRLFEAETQPTRQEVVKVVLAALSRLKPLEYIALIETHREDPDTGRPRNLKQVAFAVGLITGTVKPGGKPDGSAFQLVDSLRTAAMRKLAEGARIVSGALGLTGGIPSRVRPRKRASGAHNGGTG
jgi:hypothetical protein